MTRQNTQIFVDFAQFVADLPEATEERILTLKLLLKLYKKSVPEDDTQKQQYLLDLQQALLLFDPQWIQQLETVIEQRIISLFKENLMTAAQDTQSEFGKTDISVESVEVEPTHKPTGVNVTEPPKTEGKPKRVKSEVKPKEPQKERFYQDEDEYRQRCWNTALLNSERELLKMTAENSDVALQSEKDIVLQGSVYPKMVQQFSKKIVHVSPINKIALFSEFSRHFQHFDESGHIWFSFTDVDDQQITTPQWVQEESACIPLWRRWCDLLKWALLAPEASVFVDIHNPQQLKTDRPSICKKLFENHEGFTKMLNKENPKGEYYTYIYLHRIYSTFHQFLLPQDLNPDARPEHVFATLRAEVKTSVKPWLERLQIEEVHPAGIGFGQEFLSTVKESTENDVDVTSQRLLLENVNPQKNQVLYWLQPQWRLKNPIEGQQSDLKGRVLYYSDIL